MRTILGAIACLGLLIPSMCFANGDTGSISLAGVKVQIIAPPNPRIYIYVTLSAGCGGTTPEIEMDPTTNSVGNSMYATLLTALAAGDNVDIVTTGCTSDANEPEVTSIYLEPAG